MPPSDDLRGFRTWIEISGGALRKNYRTFRRLLGRSVLLMGVIKSNAYGHGLVTIAKAYETLGFDWLGVDSISEAVKLRREGIRTKILVLGYTQPENIRLAGRTGISLAVSSFETLAALSRIRGRLSVHVKVDTGMHRQGFFPSEIPKVIARLRTMPHIAPEGVFTHFASAKDPYDRTATRAQIARFEESSKLFLAAGFRPIFHAAATAGTLNFPESHFDMVRVGMGMYGYWPAEETKAAFAGGKRQGFSPKKLSLHPVLTWKTVIGELKWVEKGEKVGYDYTESLRRKTRLAVLPVGYWHGFWRAFSSKAWVLVRNRKAKVVGRVSMDMAVVDVTGIRGVRVGDEAVLIGRQGKVFVSAEELGAIAGTSSYEILTRINPLIQKRFR